MQEAELGISPVKTVRLKNIPSTGDTFGEILVFQFKTSFQQVSREVARFDSVSIGFFLLLHQLTLGWNRNVLERGNWNISFLLLIKYKNKVDRTEGMIGLLSSLIFQFLISKSIVLFKFGRVFITNDARSILFVQQFSILVLIKY